MPGFLSPGRILAAACCASILAACGGTHYTPQSNDTLAHTSSLDTLVNPYRVHTPPHPPANPKPLTASDYALATKAGWHAVAGTAPFAANGAGTPLLLTDGRVLIGDNTSNWYTLTPDITGSYINGTWQKVAALPAGYGPLYFASAVLADGKVIINGGEYNFFQQVETNLGAIYDPVKNTWTTVPPPTGWSQIGDAQSVVLPDGTYMIGNCCTSVQALYNESTGAWMQTGAGKADGNSEEGWTLLPSGNVITADVGSAPKSEMYAPATGKWSFAGMLASRLIAGYEIGPQTLRPDGTILVEGANANSAIYSLSSASWSAGPSMPTLNGAVQDAADAPAAVLPNGKILTALSPGVYQAPASFWVFDGTKFTHIGGIPNAKNDSSYNLRLMVLPTGQILATDGSNSVQIYTSAGVPLASIAPSITHVATTVKRGSTYKVTGVRFNGATQANTYGDDAQSATNYPLVEIVNDATAHVFFARTHGHSSMAVGSPSSVFTNFDVSSTTETGASKLYVVTNGIKSQPVSVTVQ